MPIYFAEVHAKVLSNGHIGEPNAQGMLVQYLLAAPNINSATTTIQEHAIEHYLDQGEIVECYEVERSDALAHQVTIERDLDIDDPCLFEVITLGSYGSIHDGWFKRLWSWVCNR